MPTYTYAKLLNVLKGFEDPDTNSQYQGRVSSGKYLVEEVKENFPNQDSDYAQIVVPALGDEKTWICTRWKDKRYATITEEAIQPAAVLDFTNDEFSIDEESITELLPSFYDFGYDLDQARYPFKLRGFNAPLAPPNQNNCCTFVEALLVKAWENSMDNFSWSMNNHRQMMIFSANDYFSPVTCLVNAHMAEAVEDHDQSPHAWTTIQGWRKQWTSGHTFIILDHHPETDRVLTLESNSTHNLNGVGYRKIGNIKDFNNPPENWWQNDQLWTWQRIKSTYQFRNQCILKVKNLIWFK
ncbi:MAG: hypothetical protein KAQ62_23255 [Cyclobacteriaceae bacterium]|nr:hypothetical protein [Cyclobacteriaceae bacterium]